MGTWTRALVPAPLLEPLGLIRLLWSTGLLSEPRVLASQLRHRTPLARVTRALFYQRYATALLLAHETGLLEALRAGPRSPDELALRCGLLPRATAQLLRILDAQGAVQRAGDGYALTPFAKTYLVSGDPQSMAPMLDLMAAQAASFSAVRSGLRTGAVPGELDIFSDGGRHLAFLDAVNAYLHRATSDLLHRIELPPIRSFVVGSMGVSFSARLMTRFPEARVTYGCLPHLMREVPRLRRAYRVPADRVDGSHDHGGDPFADRWGSEDFDLVFLTKKMILDPERRLGEGFATKAFEVLRRGGVAIFWETLHPDTGPTSLPRAMESLMDLVASPAGPVQTESSLAALLEGIGYRDVTVVPCLGGQTTFVVARR